MTGVVREGLEYRITARNDQPNSPNPIHRDGYARSLGYPGGLVAGGTLYNYVCDAAIRMMGGDWLVHGYGEVRFRAPVFDGDELTVAVKPIDNRDWQVGLLCDGLRTEATVGPYRESIHVDDLRRGAKEPPQMLAKDVSLKGMPLPEPDERSLSREQLEQYLTDAGLDGTPLAQELRSRGLFTPHFITGAPFELLWRHRPYAVVIHTSSVTEWVGSARLGQTLYTWGAIDDAFEKRGRFYITQRVTTVDNAGNQVARMLHTGTYEPTPQSG
ncbi:MAG: MaoC family dehydratase [Ktedonobacterales bacterium]